MGIYVGENPLSVPGMSAYQEAIKGGFAGTREDFDKALKDLPGHLADEVRHITAEERKSWNNKAPGGFGLGDSSKELSAADDLNNIRATGWYDWSWNSHPKNAPDNNWHNYGCAMHVFSTTPGGYAIQTVYDLSDDVTHGCVIQRTIYVYSSSNIYYPWEWVNPPMTVGIEYRTTERYMAYPVYVKLINLGAMPSAGSTKKISVSNLNIRVPISMNLTWGNAASENFVINDYAPYVASAGFDNANINIVGGPNADPVHYTISALLKYTKNT